LDGISPAIAASYPTSAVTATTPHYRDITISNFTANAQANRTAGIIWGLPESSISNVTLINVHLIGSKTFGIYDAKNVRLIDCSHSVPSGVSQFSFYNTDVTFFQFHAFGERSHAGWCYEQLHRQQLYIYNALMTLINTNALGLNTSITLGASTFIISNNLALSPSNALNFILGSNPAIIVVKGNLALGGTNNIISGAGFTSGTYTLMTYTGSLSGTMPTLGATPAGFACTLNTNTAGQVNLEVIPPLPGTPTNLTAFGTNLLVQLNWFAASNAASYNLKRSTTNGGTYSLIATLAATNYSDSTVNPGRIYFYVVSATNAAAESANSIQVSAIPLPSNQPANIIMQTVGGHLQLSWPQDHLGWHAQIQTNNGSVGLGTNWITLSDSATTNGLSIPVDSANGSMFLRLVYP